MAPQIPEQNKSATEMKPSENGGSPKDEPVDVLNELVALAKSWSPVGTSVLEQTHSIGLGMVDSLCSLWSLTINRVTTIVDPKGNPIEVDRDCNVIAHLARLHHFRQLSRRLLPRCLTSYRGLSHSYQVGPPPAMSCAHLAVSVFCGVVMGSTFTVATKDQNLDGWIVDVMPFGDPICPQDGSEYLRGINGGLPGVVRWLKIHLQANVLGVDYEALRCALVNEFEHARYKVQQEQLVEMVRPVIAKATKADRRDPANAKDVVIRTLFDHGPIRTWDAVREQALPTIYSLGAISHAGAELKKKGDVRKGPDGWVLTEECVKRESKSLKTKPRLL